MDGIGGIVCFVLGWFLAQFGKMIGDLLKNKRPLNFREIVDAFTRSGGMPSGHTASFLGLSVFLGYRNGFCSSIFALAICTTAIVIYDAVNVRYAVGEQGKLLNILSSDSKQNRKVKVVEGHTVPQVIAGAILGIAVATGINFLI